MSRKGRSCDNARMEGFFGTLKAELWHPRDWSGWAPADLMAEVDRWMRWFREGRRSQALGWLTPDEHRRALGYAVQDVQENVRSPVPRPFPILPFEPGGQEQVRETS